MKIFSFIVITIYLLIVSFLWNNRYVPFNLLFSDKGFILYPIIKISYNLILVILVVLVLIQIFRFLNKLFKTKENEFENIGFKNKKGQSPKLKKIKPYKYRPNAFVYIFKAYNLSINDFEEYKDRLETIINANIFYISYGGRKNTKYVYVYAIPYKHLKPIEFPLDSGLLIRVINFLLIGGTGTGKSYFLKIYIVNLLMFYLNAKLVLCDYKNGKDFSCYSDCLNYYGYTKVIDGINSVYEELKRRQESDNNNENEVIIFVIDEYNSFLLSLDKKTREDVLDKMSEILFMGREYKIIPIISMQRADSVFFKNGGRDQFKNILALGNISKEQKEMIFKDFKDEMIEINQLGEGYLYQDGKNYLERIKVKKVNAEEERKIDYYIRKGLNK